MRTGRSGVRKPVRQEIFPTPVQTEYAAHPAYCTKGTGVLYRGKNDGNMVMTTKSSEEVKDEYGYTPALPFACMACYQETLTFNLITFS
jgi:hypothetical protein